ncbi:unnamed protein product [Notodromas monacha]|uniref:Uncharacterized protein n=1 Tax=Notodromas monacha TaxID=399045 RepID=A0A7R9BT78_9CRUS|nr:unnamed protein product [Notodromas monacha]CAG0921306.1 unnamed protein product [Notodromas monacha]
MSSPGFFDFDTNLLPLDDPPGQIDDYDACNEQTFGLDDLGDEEWNEDANADIIQQIEKERIPSERDELVGPTVKPSNDDQEDFEYITDSIQQLMLDDDDDDFGLGPSVPFDDPAIVSVPKTRPVAIKLGQRGISPPPGLPEFDEYGSPAKTNIWAPPNSAAAKGGVSSAAESDKTRPRLPPGLDNLQYSGVASSGPQTRVVSSGRPFDDPSVVHALPKVTKGGVLPEMKRMGTVPSPAKIISQPKTLAELEQEMLANDAKNRRDAPPSYRVPPPQEPPPPQADQTQIRQRPPVPPFFPEPPPGMFGRFQGPPPGLPQNMRPNFPPVRGYIMNGPIPHQIQERMAGILKPVPIDGRVRMPQRPQYPVVQNLPSANMQQQHMRPMTSSPPFDEFAGFLTDKDKTRLQNIQLTQLNTNNPYIDDYYYMVKELRAIEQLLRTTEAGNMDLKERLKVVCSGILKDQSALPSGGHAAYVPPVMEKSLGCIQVVSAIAPRKTVNIKPVSSRSQQSVLLLIENLFLRLLELEDMRRLASLMSDELLKEATLSRLELNLKSIASSVVLESKVTLMAVSRHPKGRILLARLLTFPTLGAKIGPKITDAAMSTLSVAFPREVTVDRDVFLLSLTSPSCIGRFSLEEVAVALIQVLKNPVLMNTVLVNRVLSLPGEAVRDLELRLSDSRGLATSPALIDFGVRSGIQGHATPPLIDLGVTGEVDSTPLLLPTKVNSVDGEVVIGDVEPIEIKFALRISYSVGNALLSFCSCFAEVKDEVMPCDASRGRACYKCAGAYQCVVANAPSVMSGVLVNGDAVETDPAAEFLAREQDELAGLGDDLPNVGRIKIDGEDEVMPCDASRGRACYKCAGAYQCVVANAPSVMSGVLVNGDAVETDPAAEFLAREQDELAGLGDDLPNVGRIKIDVP